jgi:uncharacterized protein
MKVVLDTNILASGIFWGGAPLKILTLWKQEKIQVLASEAILDEYLKTIKRISQKLDRTDLHRAWALTLPSRVKLVAIKKSFRLCRDPKDDMFIDCAIAGKARIIVSGDKDLLTLEQIMNVRIVGAQRFLREF